MRAETRARLEASDGVELHVVSPGVEERVNVPDLRTRQEQHAATVRDLITTLNYKIRDAANDGVSVELVIEPGPRRTLGANISVSL